MGVLTLPLKFCRKTAKDINMSPFLPHTHISSHSPRSPYYSFIPTTRLTVWIRGVDGARRFTGAKVVDGKGMRLGEVNGPWEPEISRNSTAGLAYQLLDPVVSEEEQAEYQG